MLTQEQIDAYDKDGYVVLNDVFSPNEIAAMQSDAEMLATDRAHMDANIFEKDGKTLRAAWAPEIDSEVYQKVYQSPRVLGAVKQLMGDDVFLYQSRLNYKRPKSGDLFQWHQDYQAWKTDTIPNGDPRAILTVLITLDDTTEQSGPLTFIPGSQKVGPIEPFYDTETTSYPLYMIDDAKMDAMFKGEPEFQCLGPAGTVVIFAATLVHMSEKNRSENGRRNLYFAYSRDDNRPQGPSKRKLANDYIQNPTPDVLEIGTDAVLAG